MKSLFITLVFLPAFFFAQNNTLVINGKTNVNSFKCFASEFQAADGSFRDGRLPDYKISIKDFDCNGKMITSDFRKTLNADRFPQMNIRFLSIKKPSAGKAAATIEVKLMDKLRSYNVNLATDGKNYFGKQTVKFSEFGIVPPKRMGGMVVVQDDLNLSFILANN